MREGREGAWLEHICRAFLNNSLTVEQFKSDVRDVNYGMPPRNFLVIVEEMEPIYTDHIVPFGWVRR